MYEECGLGREELTPPFHEFLAGLDKEGTEMVLKAGEGVARIAHWD